MEIKGPEGLGGAREIQPPRRTGRQGAREGSSRTDGDKVEISGLGRLKGLLAHVPEVRAERIAELKKKIRDGGYPPGELVDQAFDKMLSEETGGG